MLDFLKFQPRLPGLKDFPMESYSTDFSLERLVLGVDNIRCDVRLSPSFCSATAKMAALLIERETGIWTTSEKKRMSVLAREQEGYRQLYGQIMSDAVNKARAAKEMQVDFLAQIAILSMVHDEIRKQYDILIGHCKSAIRRSDLAHHEDHKKALKLKENLAHVLQRRESVQQKVGLELCGSFREIRETDIREMREAVFGQDLPFLFDLLTNPIVHMDNPFNDHFMIEEYDLCLGRRVEDPDRYEMMLSLMRSIFGFLDLAETAAISWTMDRRRREISAAELPGDDEAKKFQLQRLDQWIKRPENIDLLFEPGPGQETIQSLETSQGGQGDPPIPTVEDEKPAFVDGLFFPPVFPNRAHGTDYGFIRNAAPLSRLLPPLVPQQVLQYLINPKSRKLVRSRFNRLKQLYGKTFRMWPLNRKVVQMERMGSRRKKQYLVRFLRAFFPLSSRFLLLQYLW